jgi:hypothetical protein
MLWVFREQELLGLGHGRVSQPAVWADVTRILFEDAKADADLTDSEVIIFVQSNRSRWPACPVHIVQEHSISVDL